MNDEIREAARIMESVHDAKVVAAVDDGTVAMETAVAILLERFILIPKDAPSIIATEEADAQGKPMGVYYFGGVLPLPDKETQA